MLKWMKETVLKEKYGAAGKAESSLSEPMVKEAKSRKGGREGASFRS